MQLGMICYVSCFDRYSAVRGSRPDDVVGPSRPPMQASTSILPSSSLSSLCLSSSSLPFPPSSTTFLSTSITERLSDQSLQLPSQRGTFLSSLSSSKSDIDDSVEKKELASSYHLVWNQGFGKKFLLTTIGLATVHGLVLSSSGMATTTTTMMMTTIAKFFSGYMSSMGLSLLASSCCLIQIIVNTLVGTVGCLGLNTSLGPSRPYFLALLFYLSATTRSVAMNPTKLILRLGIAFLPEIVHFWNNQGRKFPHKSTTLSKHSNGDNIMNTNTNGMVATLYMDVPAMGCVACINKIDRTIQNQMYEINSNQNEAYNDSTDSVDSIVANYNDITTTNKNSTSHHTNTVVDVSSCLDPQLPKGGSTKVVLFVKSKDEAERIGQTLIESLDKVGFGGSTISKLEFS